MPERNGTHCRVIIPSLTVHVVEESPRVKGYFTSDMAILPVERQAGLSVDGVGRLLPPGHVLPDYGGKFYDARVGPPAHSRHLVSPVGGRDATVHHVAVDQLLEEGQASLVFDETAVLN